MSAGNSHQRARMLEALGAEVVLVPQVDGAPGQVTGNDIAVAAQIAEQLAADRGGFYVDQFNAIEGLVAHEVGTARELIEAAGSRIDGWVACVGTGSTFLGVARGLRAANPHVAMAPVEPSGCEVLVGKPITKHKHLLQGTGYGFVPPHWDPSLVSYCVAVTDEEAMAWKRRLAGERRFARRVFGSRKRLRGHETASDGRNSVRWYGRDSPAMSLPSGYSSVLTCKSAT